MNNLLPLIKGSVGSLGDCRIRYDSVGRLRLRCDPFDRWPQRRFAYAGTRE